MYQRDMSAWHFSFGARAYHLGMGRVTDYRIAKRALVRAVSDGAVRVDDVCDAHPELLRAARHVGVETDRTCPICALADERADVPPDDAPTLRLVTYVYGDDLKRKSGHIVWTREELAGLAAQHRSFVAYVVEACLVCGWNHLAESQLLGHAHAV
ncbi:hypothetical protein BH20ACT8_BH20ACT8_00760 [soil metagenome]